ncbi:hypothetical protein, partial [Escherichia coli]|uniref:hypothetical protein n=1 Tax=Escherichia coli TaxID=562 RepID=UPI003F898315
MPGLSLVLKVLANAKLPDALRLSGLHELCNILNLHAFVGRIRRLRRIRHFTTSTCQQFENTG